jgi:hypothetical protein
MYPALFKAFISSALRFGLGKRALKNKNQNRNLRYKVLVQLSKRRLGVMALAATGYFLDILSR